MESQIQKSGGARRINPPVQEAVKLRERRANFDFPWHNYWAGAMRELDFVGARFLLTLPHTALGKAVSI